MPEFDNPSFLRLGAGAALAFGSLLRGAPELFLGVPEMVPAMELAEDSAREPVTALDSQPWVSSSMADRLTLLNIALPAALVAPASLEEDLVSTAKALEQVLEQKLDLAPFADSFCGSTEMKILLLSFVPFRLSIFGGVVSREKRPEVRTVRLGEEDEGLREWCSIFETLFAALLTGINRKNGTPKVILIFATNRQFRATAMSFACEIDVLVLRNGTRVPNPLSQLRNTLRNGTFGAKSRFSISQCVSLRNGCSDAVALSCAKFTSHAKYTRRDFSIFAEWFGNKMLISQRFPSPASSFFPVLLCLAPISTDFFFSIPLKFLPPGII
ncbi:hypothetical protein AAG906_021884 [Vitis piasezkii]